MRSNFALLLSGLLLAAPAVLAGCGTDLGRLVSHRDRPTVTTVVPLPEPELTRPESSPGAVAVASESPAAGEAPSPVGSAPASPPECQPPPAASGLRSTQGPGEGSGASEQRFPFEDEQYLLANQSNGGLVYVPGAVPAGASVPLVIFLHGTNANGPLHRGLGSGAGPLTSSAEIEAGYDLRPVVQDLIDRREIAPVMIGGPSQTREAGRGHDLWPAFDPGAFADAVDRSLGDRARVDRSRLVVVGHSGAGCSPTGGGLVGLAQRLGRASEQAPPRALVAIDTCLDDWVCEAFAGASQATPVWVYFQTATWERPFEAFRASFLPAGGDPPATADEPERRRLVALEGLSGEAAHNLSLPKALRLALQGLLPPRACP